MDRPALQGRDTSSIAAGRALLALLAVLFMASVAAAAAGPVTVGRTFPAFTLPDTHGAARTAASLRGHPVALFFFCGCDVCHHCATLWGEAQKSDALTAATSASAKTTTGAKSTAGATPRTVIVFGGDASAAKAFAQETGLSATGTTLLVDPPERVAARYGAYSCPRVFVLDASGRLRYTNDEPGSDPQTTPVVTLVSRALTALRAASLPASHATAASHTSARPRTRHAP